jgi:hypothetical protein
MGQTNVYVSYPIVVRGSSPGYDWWSTSREAFAQLHRLCALMSVAMDECWVVREGPWPDAGTDVRVPDRIGLPALPEGGARETPTLVKPPDWMDAGIVRAMADPRFARRLAGFQEGMEAQYEHPSLAAIAFVAVVESVGAQLFPLRRCKECGSQVGSGKAFRQALRLALPENEAQLLDATYGVRSKTAHEGQLHGSEPTFGMTTGPSFWGPNPAFAFEWQQLWMLRKAARVLIERDLSGTLPPPGRRTP